MTNDEAHERLIEWLHGLLGIVVIKDRQQADRPPTPYGMVDLANFQPLHEHVDDIKFSQEGDDFIASPDYEIEYTFLFFVYGAQGEDHMRRLYSAARMREAQTGLMPDLVIHDVSLANSIPELVGQKWEPRTQVNIVVRGKSSDGFAVDTIEDFDINITGERA